MGFLCNRCGEMMPNWWTEQICDRCQREDKLKARLTEAESENKRLRGVLEEAREEIQNCYGRDIPLTEDISEALEGGS